MNSRKTIALQTGIIILSIPLGLFAAYRIASYLMGAGSDGDYTFETLQNRSAEVTLAVRQTAGFDGESYIYVIAGRYSKREVPKDGNYIKLHDGQGMIYDWLADNTFAVYVDRDPEISNFHSDQVKVQVVNDRNEFTRLQKAGKTVVRYELNVGG